jgi:hypothetical protein
MQMEEKDVPLGSRRWKPLSEEEFLDLDPSNPRKLQWRRQSECVLEQRRKRRCYRKDASGEEDGDIYNLCSRAKWGFDTMFVWKTEIHLNIG